MIPPNFFFSGLLADDPECLPSDNVRVSRLSMVEIRSD
jgi:hypothetical protein